MQMKGNNGRAARKVLIRRLSMVLISFLVCIGCLHLMGIGRSAQGPMTLKRLHHDISTSLNMQNANALRENLRSRADLLSKSMFRDFGNKQQQHHHQHQQQQQRPTLTVPQPQQHRSRHTDGPQIIDFTFDDNSDPVGLQLLLEAQVHLVDIDISDPKAVVGDFCTLNFAAHKADPSLVPMFRHLVQASPECDKVRYRVLLNDYVRHATEHDAKSDAKSKSLNLTAVVFHESRCGSTLVSNALIAMNPAKHRVYSESAPPIAALLSMCGETFKGCTLHQASRVLKDVMYAMGRTNDPNEERVFFKIQSIGTRTLKVFQHAFPNVPFMFVYREPVQVMMSQLKQGTKNANCVRPRMRPPPSVVDVCAKKGLAVGELSDEEYCAAHLVRWFRLSCSCGVGAEHIQVLTLISLLQTYYLLFPHRRPRLPKPPSRACTKAPALPSITSTCPPFCGRKSCPPLVSPCRWRKLPPW
jgi:hypothetical protein